MHKCPHSLPLYAMITFTKIKIKKFTYVFSSDLPAKCVPTPPHSTSLSRSQKLLEITSWQQHKFIFKHAAERQGEKQPGTVRNVTMAPQWMACIPNTFCVHPIQRAVSGWRIFKVSKPVWSQRGNYGVFAAVLPSYVFVVDMTLKSNY